MYIGFPHRYVDRYQDAQNFPHLPDWKHRQKLIRRWGRSGTAMTDSVIMTSRDGETFRRTDEAVSYTHLDVYKRQHRGRRAGRLLQGEL